MIFRSKTNKTSGDGRQVSVILKRQVPIRFDEPSRSWLGGLPMMPTLVKWPRDKEGAPLHFIAQVACEDLPAGLWNGQGPRKGWLLLFVETLKLEDEAEGGIVQTLHINRLGPEREPPKDMPTVRHTMSDYIDYTKPNIRPGVPKLWRKWPVDLVEQSYVVDGSDDDLNGSPNIPAEELYDAPVATRGLYGAEDLGLDRPLTWRGALYVVEGLVRDLKPDEFERNFTGSFGLLNAPEPDQSEFNEEYQRRVNENPACADREVGWGPRVGAITDQIRADLAAERRTGWIMRSYTALEKEKARYEHWKAKYQEDLETAGDSLDANKLADLKSRIEYQCECIEKTEEARAYLDELFAPYRDAEGEKRFTAEIKALGEAHLAWGQRMAAKLNQYLDLIRTKDLDAPLSAADWAAIKGEFNAEKTVFWCAVDSRVLKKVERSLSTKRYLDMAIREDLLDLYTRDDDALKALSGDQREILEQKLRYMDEGVPHRLGGQANPIQEGPSPNDELLFQIASDRAMGWMWGDLGALYVTIAPKRLRGSKFSALHAMIEGS